MTSDNQPVAWDPGLQPERTALAWRRLGLTLLALALAALRFAWPILGAWALLPTLLVAASATGLVAHSTKRHQTLGHPARGPGLRDGRILLSTALACMVMAVLALIAVFARP